MGADEYDRTVFYATGFPDPSQVECSRFHTLGEWQVRDTDAAVDAIVTRRLQKVRRAIRDAAHFTPENRAILEAQDFLAFGEYLEVVRRIEAKKSALAQTENLDRRRDHDRAHQPHKPHFYRSINAPSPTEEAFIRCFDPHRFVPSRAGYLAYLERFAVPVFGFLSRRLPALIEEEDRKRHTYITGGSGSGKSELLKTLICANRRNRPRKSVQTGQVNRLKAATWIGPIRPPIPEGPATPGDEPLLVLGSYVDPGLQSNYYPFIS